MWPLKSSGINKKPISVAEDCRAVPGQGVPGQGFPQTNQAWHLATEAQSWQILAGTTLAPGSTGSLPMPVSSPLHLQDSQVGILHCKSHLSHSSPQNTDALPTIHSEIPNSWPCRTPHSTPTGFPAKSVLFLTTSSSALLAVFDIPYPCPPPEPLGRTPHTLQHTQDLPATTSGSSSTISTGPP